VCHNLARLFISDLADEEDIGVLAEQGSKRRCEGRADLLVNRHLRHSGGLVLTGSSTMRSSRARSDRSTAAWAGGLPEAVGPVAGDAMGSVMTSSNRVRTSSLVQGLQRDAATLLIE
jgi:hypothetical protein